MVQRERETLRTLPRLKGQLQPHRVLVGESKRILLWHKLLHDHQSVEEQTRVSTMRRVGRAHTPLRTRTMERW
jgi:hypothetical protein